MKVSAVVLFLACLTLLSACEEETIGPNRTPVAQAGQDKTVEVNQTVRLDASDSYDPDPWDDLTFDWDLLAIPDEARSRLVGDQRMETCLTPDVPGPWIVGLTVSDGKLTSELDVATVLVKEPAQEPTEPAEPDIPPETDLVVTGVMGEDIYDNRLGRVRVGLKVDGPRYVGPLYWAITAGWDPLPEGKELFGRNDTIESITLEQDTQYWLNLIEHEMEMPEESKRVFISVAFELDKRVDEPDTDNNAVSDWISRAQLLRGCGCILADNRIRMKSATGCEWTVYAGERFEFPECDDGNCRNRCIEGQLRNVQPFRLFLDLTNACAEEQRLNLSLVRDWTSLDAEGDNHVIQRIETDLEGGETDDARFRDFEVYQDDDPDEGYKTLAIVWHHERGDDILFSTPVKVPYRRIVGGSSLE